MREQPAEPVLPIVVGLVAPTGTKLDQLQSLLISLLEQAGRRVQLVPVTHLLEREVKRWGRNVRSGPEDVRITSQRIAATQLRAETMRGDLLTLLALERMHTSLIEVRHDHPGKCAFVVRSLKHPDEARMLREVFGPWFFLVAGYSAASIRYKNLARKISEDRRDKRTDFESRAKEISERDEGDPDNPFGPQVRDTFHLAGLRQTL